MTKPKKYENRASSGPPVDDRAISRATYNAAKLGSENLLKALLTYYAKRRREEQDAGRR